MTIAQSLYDALTGVFNNFVNEAPASAAMIAPLKDSQALSLQYIVASEDAIPSSDDPVLDSSVQAQFKMSNRSFTRATLDLAVKDGFATVIPDRIVESLNTSGEAIDLITLESARIVDKYWLAHVGNTATQLGSLTDAGTIALTDPTLQFAAALNAQISAIKVKTGTFGKLRAYVPMPVALKQLTLLEVLDAPGISIGTTSATRTAVTSVVTLDKLRSFYQTQLIQPVELVVEDFVGKSAGTNAYAITTGMWLVQVSDMPNESALTTITQRMTGSTLGSGPFSVYVDRVGPANGYRPGYIVAVDAAWQVKLWSANRGVRFATTLS